MYPEISKKIIPSKKIKSVRALVLKELSDLQADYFPELLSSDFMINYIYIGSPFLLRLESRCFFKGLANELISDDLLKFVKEHIDGFTLYHRVFLRIHHPDSLSNSIERKDNVTATPLHYDKYVSNSLTTWIPLHDIDTSTGSLCFTTNNKLIEMTGTGLELSDFHDSKISDKAEYINLLKKNISTINCKEGQVVIFDNKLLHGGTYSQSKMRISVDLRWIENKNRKYERSPNSIPENLKLVKRDMLTSLYVLKDYKFIYRETLKLKYISIHIIQTLKRFTLLKKFIKFLKRQI